jgi:hypothetical protein
MGNKLYIQTSDGVFAPLSLGSSGGGTSVNGGGKYVCDGRLTLTTATPITTADVTAATTLYYTPYMGDQISLYDGVSAWGTITFTELSLDISAYTADKNYDIWVYNNSGTATMDSTVWTDDSTRATALATQNGVYVKTGATTRRYVGTIRITSTLGQCEDSLLNRFVWNMYNRCYKRISKTTVSSHTYNSVTIRPWNNDAANKVSFVLGDYSKVTNATTGLLKSNTDGGGAYIATSVDETSSWTAYTSLGRVDNYNAYYITATGVGSFPLASGYHFITAVESGNASVATFGWFVINGYIDG